jgi:hypothetical protein
VVARNRHPLATTSHAQCHGDIDVLARGASTRAAMVSLPSAVDWRRSAGPRCTPRRDAGRRPAAGSIGAGVVVVVERVDLFMDASLAGGFLSPGAVT